MNYFQCYLETLNTMVTLQNQYLQSKNEKNIFHRYNQLRSMIKVDTYISSITVCMYVCNFIPLNQSTL